MSIEASNNKNKPIKTVTKQKEVNSKIYDINLSLKKDNTITIEFKCGEDIEATSTCTYDELITMSRYFAVFISAQEIFDKIKSMEYTITYSTHLLNVIFPIKCKSISSFTFAVPIINFDSIKYMKLIDKKKSICQIERVIYGKSEFEQKKGN